VDKPEQWLPLIEAIHEVFDKGFQRQLVLGLDSGYTSESRPFAPMTFLPEPPFLYMFTEVLPAFRKLGLTQQEERLIMEENPQSLLAFQ
jgi:predicted metal-dependent phosphotriesterase family hydrolase